MLSIQRLDKLQTYDLALNTGLGIVTAVALVGIYFATFYSFNVQHSAVQTEATELRELIRQASEFNEQQQALTTQLTKSEQAAADLTRRIPSAPRESDFLSQFCELAERTGIEVADYRPGMIDQRENHHEMEVQISTSGEYAALGKFLQEIDHIPRLCRLTQLDVGTEPTGSKLRAEMLFRIYFAPPTAAVATKKG
jgi:Tfp pilus assembly protein PilO